MAPEARPAGRRHLWLLLPATALAALWLAWRCLAAVDFLYPVFYDTLNIESHIEHFAPQNRHKDGFEATTREERLRLFGAIVDAIHNSGRGLAEIEYHHPAGDAIDRLLREPEIVHLQDVAKLVDRMAPIGWLAVALVGVQLLLVRLFGWTVPALGRLLGVSVLATLAGVLLVFGVGARRVFYAMHELLFPPENPWYFYYQDSLMSTMMKAPDLFGAIAAVLVLVALLIYAALLSVARCASLR